MIKKFAPKALMLGTAIAIAIESILLTLVPDDMLIARILTNGPPGDILSFAIPRQAASFKIRFFGYKSCMIEDSITSIHMPLVNFIANGYNSRFFPTESDSLFQAAISKGCSVNEYDRGATPLHTAALFNEPKLAALLLSHGANMSAPLRKPGSQGHEMSALELAEYVAERKNDQDWSELLKILALANEHPPNKAK